MELSAMNSLLSQFGQRIGLPDLALDDSGYCCIGFDDVFVNVETSGDRLCLYAWIGTLDEAARTRHASDLLDANFLFKGTQGATLGVDQESGDALLALQLPASTLTVDTLEASVENFVNTVERWQKRLTEEGSTTSAASPAFSPSMLQRA